MAKQINARIKIKHDVDSNWIKAVNFIPAEGELIVYEADNIKKDSEVPRLKVGDGINKINNLPFITDPYVLKVNGKQLSTNDFTNNHKKILDKILALGDNIAFTDTTYQAATGLNLLGTTFYNTGILSLNYNQNKNLLEFNVYNINNDNIETKTINLNSLVLNTLNSIQNSNTPFIKAGNENGTILVNNQTVSVYGLGSLAYKDENFIYDIIQSGSGEKEITIGAAPDGGTKIYIDPTTSTWNYLYENKYVTTYSGLVINNNDEKPWEIVASRPPSEQQLILKTGIFSNGVEIPENSDLNSFTTSGLYISKNSTISGSLINAPLKTRGFKLIVLDGYTSTIKSQLVITSLSSIFYRTYASGNWTEWVDLTKNQEDYLPITGGTMTGTLEVPYLQVQNIVNNTPTIAFNTMTGISRGSLSFDAATNIRFYLSHFHTDMDSATTKYADRYVLPAATAGLTNDAWYNILTSKNAVTVAQGGTGATTASKALQNLGALPITGGTLTGALAGTSISTSGVIKTEGNLHVTRDSYPSIFLKNASENELARIYVGTGAGEYKNLYFRVWENADTSHDAILKTDGSFTADKIYGAVWNDYAEFRKANSTEPGRCVQDWEEGEMIITEKRLLPACKIISDTYGFAIGETEEDKTPIAVAGRVLAYPHENIESFKIGDAVCSGPKGTVSKMTREEIINYPDRIIGIVSEIPNYEIWKNKNIQVNGRIWIYVR